MCVISLVQFEELRAWLSAISGNREVSTCEVKWVMSMAGVCVRARARERPRSERASERARERESVRVCVISLVCSVREMSDFCDAMSRSD